MLFVFSRNPLVDVIFFVRVLEKNVNPLRAIPTKLLNTLKQFVGKLPTNYLSASPFSAETECRVN